MPAKNIHLQSLRTNDKRSEVITIVTATGVHPDTHNRAAEITLEVRIVAIPNENPRATSRESKTLGDLAVSNSQLVADGSNQFVIKSRADRR